MAHMTAFDSDTYTARRQEAVELVKQRGLGGLVIGTGAEFAYLTGSWTSSHERLTALHELASGHGEAGPVQMAGRVAAYRRRPSCGGGRAGTLELVLQPR